MKITPTILSIPPYLSASWDNISSLHLQKEGLVTSLVVTLRTGNSIHVPNLDEPTIRLIFDAHSRYSTKESAPLNTGGNVFSFPLKLDGSLIDSLGSSMQHNPEMAHLPPLPEEILKQITSLTKALGALDLSSLAKPEPHCNCGYCQVARAILDQTIEEESVSDEDLRFKEWEIEQMADKLYSLKNPLDHEEHYNVFLGEPIGCTCGKKNCEHIKAVLST